MDLNKVSRARQNDYSITQAKRLGRELANRVPKEGFSEENEGKGA